MTKHQTAILKLLLASVLWGLSFSIARIALVSFTTSQLLFWRFLIAFLAAELLLYIFNRKIFYESNSDIKIAKYSGFALGICLLLQIHGLNFTTATNSAFITATYVVMIPFLAYIFYKQKIRFIDVALAALALTGMVLLLDILTKSGFSLTDLNFGDLLTLACSVAAGLQIMLIGKYSKTCVSPFRFNTYQVFWSLISLLPYCIYEWVTKNSGLVPDVITGSAVLGVIALALLVSVFAFYLQVSSQKHLSTATASMLCLLEAPFSFIFAAIMLGEKVNGLQAIGALVIIISAFLSIRFEKPLEI